MARRNEELSVIGALLIDPKTIENVDRSGLCADDFADPAARLAFETIQALRADGEKIDPLVLNDRMSKAGETDYTAMIAEALKTTPTAANIGEYCRIVKDAAERAKFADAVSKASEAAFFGNWRAEADNMLSLLQTMSGGENADVMGSEELGEAFADYYEQVKENPEAAYCKTGFQDLDRQLGGGMFKSEVYIIGARPGMGKTTLAINIAENIVNSGRPVLMVSMEMTAQQIAAKRISVETGISYTSLISGNIKGGEEAQMQDWLVESKSKPFFLTTRSDLTVAEIGRRARQVPNLACLIIDYIGLVPVPQSSQQKPRYEQMTEISAGIKALAKSLNIPILALCQLNRENTSRQDKRPTMADLRDSGAIEQDAGAIILLHRPEYYQQNEEESHGIEEIELNVAKNRHAEPGVVRFYWNGTVGRISQIAREELPF